MVLDHWPGLAIVILVAIIFGVTGVVVVDIPVHDLLVGRTHVALIMRNRLAEDHPLHGTRILPGLFCHPPLIVGLVVPGTGREFGTLCRHPSILGPLPRHSPTR